MKKKNIIYSTIIIVLVIIILFLLFRPTPTATMTTQPNINVVEKGDEIGNYANENMQEAIVETLEVPGLGDLTLSDGYGVALNNPEVNKLYLQYRITNKDTSELIHETGLITPGEEIVWIPSEDVTAGKYNIRIEVYSYDSVESAGVLRVNNDIVLDLNE